MTESKKQTLGAKALELQAKPNEKIHAQELQEEINRTYMEELQKCVEQCDWTEPYYVVVLLKKEQLLHNVIRRYFVARKTLPTPQWDQTVWRYYPSSGNLEFVWTLPDDQLAMEMAMLPNEVHPEERDLYGFVRMMLDKTLLPTFERKYHGNKQPDMKLQGTEYEKFSMGTK